ncbi:MAG: RNA polymerase sigma factor [Bacilli bacterium]|mgnify:CR=1 FL=1|jgi:RNA polymerase sigma-70 factor (ECF subfamily)|nr:RNA polymerase sigma factor [Bacilli bacterium]MCH4211044.1 RNA polymerase sigma factor [Bacilli bacterium]MCH4228489.1 RNA polymerase sigma factor [Bacilli bacterium]MCI2054914.1 RNA polymerase sigma factor [Bacilli bacterium]
MERAFNSIYEEYSYLVFYVAFEILRNNDDSKDVTNETFMKMYESRHSIKNDKSLKYYLVSISKNLALNKKKVSSRYVDYDDEISGAGEEKSDDFSSYVTKFKGYLDEEEISLVVYHLLYDYRFREIASMKGVTTSSVSSKYKRALDKIKKHYGR